VLEPTGTCCEAKGIFFMGLPVVGGAYYVAPWFPLCGRLHFAKNHSINNLGVPIMDETTAASLSKLSTDYFVGQFPPVNHLYVDMRCFQDFNLGAVLCHVKDAKQYSYVLSQLETYNTRFKDATAEYFPELGLTDKQLQAFISDPTNHAVLERVSPMTDYYKGFRNFAVAVDNNNNMSPEGTTPTLFIGIHQIKYSQPAKEHLKNALRKIAPKWIVVLTDTGLEAYGDEILSTLDHISVANSGDMMRNERLGRLMERNEFLLMKSVHGFPFIEDIPGEEEVVPPEQILDNHEKVFSVFCDFKFVTMRVSYA
jgi:hypothetical protein